MVVRKRSVIWKFCEYRCPKRHKLRAFLKIVSVNALNVKTKSIYWSVLNHPPSLHVQSLSPCAIFVIPKCIGFGWSKVNFLHSSYYGLCFVFVLKAVLVMQGHLSCCWAGLSQSQGLFYSSDCPAVRRLVVHKELGGDRQDS